MEKWLQFAFWFRKIKQWSFKQELQRKAHRTSSKLPFPRVANQSTGNVLRGLMRQQTHQIWAHNWNDFRILEMFWRQQRVQMEGQPWYKPDANLTQTCAVLPKGREVTGSNYLQQVIQHVYKHGCAVSVPWYNPETKQLRMVDSDLPYWGLFP